MRTVAYYRQRAAECRSIGKLVSLRDARDQLVRMAREWEALADEREAELQQRTSPPAPADGCSCLDHEQA